MVTPEQKHTPGPWKTCGQDRGGCICGMIWSVPGDCHIATAHDKWGDGPDMVYGENGKEAMQANALLIAAAPDLLDALKAFTEALNSAPPVKLMEIIAECGAKARAAIIKAEGRES